MAPAPGCVETAVRVACGEEWVWRLYRMSDAADAARADLAICEARLEEERNRLPFLLEEQLAAGAAREASCRRELAECRDLARPRGTPWWVWPVVAAAGAGAAAAAAALLWLR